MSLDAAAQAYLYELLQILLPMTETPDFDERRRLFRSEVHRAFDPEFIPTLLLLLRMFSEVPETGPEMAILVMAAVSFEARDFLAAQEVSSLSPTAAAVDLVLTPLAAGIEGVAGREPGVELAKRVICYREAEKHQAAPEAWNAFRQSVEREVERIAAAAEDLSQGEGEHPQRMAELARELRATPKRLELMEHVLSLIALGDESRMREELRHQPLASDDPVEVGAVVGWLAAALSASEKVAEAQAARQLGVLVIEEGAGTDVAGIDEYLTRLGALSSPWAEESAERRRLAAQGPAIVLPTLHRALAKLKHFGSGLDREPTRAIAERSVSLVFERATDLLSEVVDSSPPEQPELMGGMVGGLLIMTLADEDPDMRALAALLAGLRGIPHRVVVDQLQGIFVHDADELVKLAAAITLQGMAGVEDEVETIGATLIAGFVKQTVPDLPDRLRAMLEAGRGSPRDAQATASAMLMAVARSQLVQEIARR